MKQRVLFRQKLGFEVNLNIINFLRNFQGQKVEKIAQEGGGKYNEVNLIGGIFFRIDVKKCSGFFIS